jgi:hypothetical protein
MTESTPASGQQRRAFWLKHLHQWHWISSAICLIGMLLFAVTGFTLNHAGQIEASPKVVTRHGPRACSTLKRAAPAKRPRRPEGTGAARAGDWLGKTMDVEAAGREAEWSADEIYVGLPRPGGDAWVSVALEDGEVQYEVHIARLDFLLQRPAQGPQHGRAWSWFIDMFAGLPDFQRHRAVPAQASCRRPHGHVAAGGRGAGGAAAAGHPVHPLIRNRER